MKISQKIHGGDIYPIEYNNNLFEAILNSKKFITLYSVIFTHLYLYSHSASDFDILKDVELGIGITKH